MASQVINEQDVTTVYSAFLSCDKQKLINELMRHGKSALSQSASPEAVPSAFTQTEPAPFQSTQTRSVQSQQVMQARERQIGAFLKTVEQACPRFENVSHTILMPPDYCLPASWSAASLENILATRIALPVTLQRVKVHSIIARLLIRSIEFTFV